MSTDRVRPSRLSRGSVIVIAGASTAVLSAAVVLTGIASPDGPAHPSGAHPAPGVIRVEGDDRFPSDAAADWITYADHVVAVTAISEEAIPPDREEINVGEGTIGRDVTLRVDTVVWSRADAPKRPPPTFEWHAMGWQFAQADTSNRTALVLADEPRVEVGHRYIVALDWAGRCGGDPGEWLGLGEGGIVAYDHEAIGVGENEGVLVSEHRARRAAKHTTVDRGLEDRLVGQDAAALAKVLDTAEPVPRGHRFAQRSCA